MKLCWLIGHRWYGKLILRTQGFRVVRRCAHCPAVEVLRTFPKDWQ